MGWNDQNLSTYTISLETAPTAYEHVMDLCALPPLSASVAPRFVLGTHPSPFSIGAGIRLARCAGSRLT